MMGWLKFIFSALFLCLSVITYGQGIEIRGRVTDENHKPIPYATVRISGTSRGTVTDEDGKYSLETRGADTLKVSFSSIGFESRERIIINAFSPNGYILNASLKKNNKVLKEVEVTDYKARTDAMQTLDPEAVRRSGEAAGGSVEAFITTLPGVTSTSEFSTAYNVRGGSYEENSVYINGNEVYRPQLIMTGQQEGMSAVSSALVGRIDFSSGGFSAEYDDRMSSVLDIRYRKPLPFEASLTAGLMGLTASLGQSSEGFSQLHGFRYRRNTSLLSTLDEQGEYDPSFLDYQISLSGKIKQKWSIDFLGNIAVNNYNFTPTSRVTNFGTSESAKQFKVYFDGHEKDRFETWQASLNVGYRFDKNADLVFSFGGALLNEKVTQDISGEYWLDEIGSGENEGALVNPVGIGKSLQHIRDRLKTGVINFDLKGHVGINNHNLSFGAGVKWQSVKENSQEWEMRDSAGFSVSSYASSSLETFHSLTSKQELSMTRIFGFMQDSWKMRTGEEGMVSINAGVRLSWADFNREFLVSPRFLVAFVPGRGRDWVFRLSGGLFYQSPFYKEFKQQFTNEAGEYFVELNKKLKSQESLQFILGADKTFRGFDRPFKFTAEIYLKHIRNLIPYEIDNLKIVYSGINSGKGKIMGVDFRLFGQFVKESESWISVGFMNARQNLQGTGMPMPTDRRYNLSLYFTDYFPKIPRLKFFLKGILNDGLPVFPPDTYGENGYFRMPAYKRVDVGLSYALIKPADDELSRRGIRKVFRSAWIGLDVFNLFDISNVAGYYWISDVNSVNYAVPNYLTRRQFNVTLSLDF